MADLGSKAALNADVDAKVTTNGANENTGARVNDCLNNIVDTLYGSGAAPTATFSTNTNTAQDPGQDTFRFNNATIGSVTEIALSDVVGGVDKGDLNSRFTGILQFREVGTTTTVEFQITSAVHTTWTRYTVTYLKGTLPANGTVCAVRFLPSNNVKQYVARLSQSTTDAPVAAVIRNTLGQSITWSRVSPGIYDGTFDAPIDDTKLVVSIHPVDVQPPVGTQALVSCYSNTTAGASIRLITRDIDLTVPSDDVSDDILSGTPITIDLYP